MLLAFQHLKCIRRKYQYRLLLPLHFYMCTQQQKNIKFSVVIVIFYMSLHFRYWKCVAGVGFFVFIICAKSSYISKHLPCKIFNSVFVLLLLLHIYLCVFFLSWFFFSSLPSLYSFVTKVYFFKPFFFYFFSPVDK